MPELSPTSPPQVEPGSIDLRRDRAIVMLLLMFFVSGATGLAYQTIWARELHLVFGTSTFAVSAVLSAFMGGLALGGFIMAQTIQRFERPLHVYGWVELAIGGYALVFPFLVDLISPIYLGFWQMAEPSPIVFGAVQFVMVFALLLPPTAMMGATLPLLAKFAEGSLSRAGDTVGTLYGVNTAGAVFGTWLCGFILLPSLGLTGTTLGAAAANITLGIGALALSQWANTSASESTSPQSVGRAVPHELAVAAVVGVGGFASLAYEVTWTRVLGLMLGASTYGFSVMLLAFLVGIAFGGWVGGKVADRVWARSQVGGVLLALAAVQVGIALLSYGLLFTFPELPFAYVQAFTWMEDAAVAMNAGGSPLSVWAVSLILAAAIMTPPAVLMGIAFPLAVRAVVGEAGDLGRPVGRIYAFNTAGSVIGAAAAGFILLPWFEITGTVLIAALANMAAAAVAVLAVPKSNTQVRRVLWTGVIAALAGVMALVGLSPSTEEAVAERRLLMTAGMYKYIHDLSERTREGLHEYAVAQYDLLYYREGLSSVVTVAKNRETGNLWLANNGKVEASTTLDMPTQVLVSLLPFPHVEDPERVLVIGLASGITAGSVATIPDVGQIDIVEIEPAIEEAALLFAEANHHILDDPRTNLIVNDARNHLLLQRPGSYDIVVSEPSNPWISGVSNLFTREFLEMGRTRLAEGGVWSQWVQMYGMDEEDLQSLIATFADVYPHVHLFMTVEDGDLVMLGSSQPFEPNLAVYRSALARWPDMEDELATVELKDPTKLLSTWQMDRDVLRRFSARAGLNTDDNMRIEYSAPLNLGRDTTKENVDALLEYAQVPPSVEADPQILLELAAHYVNRGDFERGLTAAQMAVTESADPACQERGESLQTMDQSVGWAQNLRLTIAAGEQCLESESALAQGWARWRVAMLQYFGEDVPADLSLRAGIAPTNESTQ